MKASTKKAKKAGNRIIFDMTSMSIFSQDLSISQCSRIVGEAFKQGRFEYSEGVRNDLTLFVKKQLKKDGVISPKLMIMPAGGRELFLLGADKKGPWKGPDIANSALFEKDTRRADIYENYFKTIWPEYKLKRGDVNKVIHRLEGPFDYINLDYCGSLTQSKIDAVKHALKISRYVAVVLVQNGKGANRGNRNTKLIEHKPGHLPLHTRRPLIKYTVGTGNSGQELGFYLYGPTK